MLGPHGRYRTVYQLKRSRECLEGERACRKRPMAATLAVALTGRASMISSVVGAGDLHVAIPHVARNRPAGVKEKKREGRALFTAFSLYI